jgi:hypothetical protein
MKLNADIIYQELSKLTKIQRCGRFADELSLGRPRLYDPYRACEEACICVADRDALPAVPPNPAPFLTICVGDGLPPAWIDRGIPIFIAAETSELTLVNNAIQHLFDRYEHWDMQLRDILEDSANISQMVIASSSIFENTITVTDKSLHILARNEPTVIEDGALQWANFTDHDAVPANDASMMQDLFWGYRAHTEPYLHDDEGRYGGTWVYSINLFISGHYEGCSSLSAKTHHFRPGDQALFRHFTAYIRKALEKNLSITVGQAGSPRVVIKELLDCLPVEERRLEQALDSLQEGSAEQQWQCLRIQPVEQPQTLPVDYLCLSVRKILPCSVALVYDKGIVILLHQDEAPAKLAAEMEPFLANMKLKMGVSYPFSDLHKLRVYYRQACCALDNGMILDSQKLVHTFEEQALPYLLSQCVGEFTAKELLPPELVGLAKLTQQTSVNYWQTLQVYLDNEKNASQTAKDLYLHRSTMLQRLNRINAVIGNKMDSAASRLYYQICFYLIEEYGGLDKD